MISYSEKPTPFAKTKCGGCTALCCSYFALEIDEPDEPEDFENLRWYIIHEDVNIFVDDRVWYLQIFRKCSWLDGNKCGHYDERPTICREYSDELCDFDGVESDLVFRDVRELEAYRDEWVAKWEAKRARRRESRRKSVQKRLKKAVAGRPSPKKARSKKAARPKAKARRFATEG